MGTIEHFTIFRLDGGEVEQYRGDPEWIEKNIEWIEKRITEKPSGDRIKPKDNSRKFLSTLIKLLYMAGMVLLIACLAYLITLFVK